MRVLLLGIVLLGLPVLAAGEPRPLGDADASAGRALYLRECSGCHGERGDGTGAAAQFVDPRPRDFTKRVFKLRTTPSGQPPATADILRVIERGIPGTAMPPFGFLPEDERRKIAAYVLRLADLLDDPEPTSIADPGPAPAATPETIATGKELYADAGCASCHGPGGKGDGTQEMKDSDGRPIKARDFTTGVYRGGGDPRDLYYRFTTGMDGSPMPGFGDALDVAQRWALVAYVRSLEVKAPPRALPADPLEAGRAIADQHACRGCHVLDDGKGGDVGPDLRLSGQKLHSEWVRTFLRAPREHGKIYPWRTVRMPAIPLTDGEVEGLTRYVAAMGKRPDRAAAIPDPATFPADEVEQGKNIFVLRCAQCHALGKVVETPLASQQGPDLVNVARRVDYEWAKEWIRDPRTFDPKTRMQWLGLTPHEVDAVRMFVWSTSIRAAGAAGPTQTSATR